MKAAVIYFSGTGNTEFTANEFKRSFEESEIECDLINIEKNDKVNLNYDYYVFGAPIYAEYFPDYYVNWIKEKIPSVKEKKCIIFSTQAAQTASGPDYLNKILREKGFIIKIKECIKMPNNFYIVGFKKSIKPEIELMKENASEHVDELVRMLITDQEVSVNISKFRIIFSRPIYKGFNKYYVKKWAKKQLTVDYEKCINCGKCEKDCPSENIKIVENKITFEDKCLCCQRCIHRCPVNAFMYKGKHFEQYKIE